MLKKDEEKKRKADEAASTARFHPTTGTSRRPASSAAWATQFISEVASAAQDALKHTQSIGGACIDHPAAQQELPRRTDGDAKDLASDGVAFVGQGRVWEAGNNGTLLLARVFSLRRKEAGDLIFYGETPPVLLTSPDASPTAGSRALAGACVLDHSCGLVRPYVLSQHSSTFQLSALDTSGQAAYPVVNFRLVNAQPQACHITDGPTLLIQTGHQSVLVGFRGTEGAGRASCHPPTASGSTAAPELTEQDDGWHVHEVQLPGQCKQRSLLLVARDSKHGLPGSPQPLLCITMGCGCGAEAESHDLLLLSYTPEVGWRAEQLAQSASVRPTAICQVPQASFAALEAGVTARTPQLALATSAGEVLAMELLRGQQQPHALLRAVPVMPAAQPHGIADTLADIDHDISSEGRVEALLRGSLAERMQWPQAHAARTQPPNASCKLLGRCALPRAAHRLTIARDRRTCQLLAVCADKEGSLCCLDWPLLRQGPVSRGICDVAADASGLGISIRGQDGWLATGVTHKPAIALLDNSATGGAHDMVEGLSRPALLLPLTDRAPAKGEAQAAEGMQSVLGALRRRLQDGCRALQDAEQLHSRKAALIRSSLQLLHTHCLRTFQPTPAAAAAAPATHAQLPGSGDRPPHLRPAAPAAPAAGQAATVEGGAIGAPALVCEGLGAGLEGGQCIVRAQLKDASGRLDLRSAQLLVSCADGPVRSWPQLAQEAPQETNLEPSRALVRAQEGGSVLLSAALDSQGLVVACDRAPLNIIAVVPVWGSGSAITAAHPAVKDAVALRWGGAAQGGRHMQHLGSLRVDWAEMLRSEAGSCTARSAEAAAASQPTGGLQATAGGGAWSKPAAPCERTPFSHQEQSAEAGQAQAQASEDEQHSRIHRQTSLASGPLFPGRRCPATVQLCLESNKDSVGDVPKALQTALGMELDWQTSHGARLTSVHSSVVSLSFHGSRHAEATIQSADTSSCLLLEQCMRNSTAALGISVQRSSYSHDDIAVLSEAIAALSREIKACVSQVDEDLSRTKGTVDGNEHRILAEIRNYVIDTDMCCYKSSLL